MNLYLSTLKLKNGIQAKMTKLINLHHVTEYIYDGKVNVFPQYIRLKPSGHAKIPIDNYQILIEPVNHFIHHQNDLFGNPIVRVAFQDPIDHFKVTVDLRVRLVDVNPFDFLIDKYAEDYPFTYQNDIRDYLSHYLTPMEPDNAIHTWLNQYKPSTKNTLEFCCTLNKKVFESINYASRNEPGVQTPVQTISLHSGSCRDSAWLLCELFRHYGFASRFVSGYAIKFINSEQSINTAELHAWTEVFIPGAGWIGFDPTSGLLTANQYIPLCCTPHPNDAAPISGSLQTCKTNMRHWITIRSLDSSPTINETSQAHWDKINSLGLFVDKSLKQNNVNLTMGAEPTYLAEDKMQELEWQVGALGEDKKQRGWRLLNNLGQRFSAGGLAFIAQGKHYPGEPIPRWAYHYFWRNDDIPMWTFHPLSNTKKATLDDALILLKNISDGLGLPETSIHSLYTDLEYEQWRQQSTQEKISENALIEAYALPLHWNPKTKNWISCQWISLDSHLFLVPGDSGVGYRLPLDRLKQQFDPLFEPSFEASLFDSKDKLPPIPQLNQMLEERNKLSNKNKNVLKHTINTALCVECKDNQIYVFIPPINQCEYFVDLMNTIEWACRKTNTSVILNGYCPPIDNRLNHFSVTPDPGVLEINIHPSFDWAELVEKNHIIEEVAKQCHLTSTKILPNGRVLASGGGNHMTLGGKTPEESPFLRRPDLLESLISFWQHHPCLSYLFAGLYVGPSSQAPRIDEARHDSLYEIELAFQQFHEKQNIPSWEIDRLLRHLLSDVTGNRHRAEFCIDKMFSPDSESGRQGLLELRAFEMAPNPKQTLLQILLVRTLIACFWQTPYHHSLIRWGTQLHDRFFLPHFLWSDLLAVLGFLHKEGFDFASEWFTSFYNFRFPFIGHLSTHNMTLELRIALEPWNVIGSDINSGSTSRTVDSSLERLQVKISGYIPQHYQVTCNGIDIPFHSTGTQHEYIAGVRFKARQNAISTHPLIPIHTPLRFDIIDRNTQTCLASCTYNTDQTKYNQFEIVTPSSTLVNIIESQINAEFPLTLPSVPATLRQKCVKT